MSTKKYTVYWDACIFISLICNEKRPNREMDGVWECIEKILNGKIQLMVLRNLFFGEVDFKSANQVDVIRDLMKRPNIVTPSVDLRVEKIATELRDFYNKKGSKKLTKNDSLHLAAAIHYKADAFYTFDNGKKKNSLSLLSLNGNVANYPLRICKPPVTQYKLDFVSNYPLIK